MHQTNAASRPRRPAALLAVILAGAAALPLAAPPAAHAQASAASPAPAPSSPPVPGTALQAQPGGAPPAEVMPGRPGGHHGQGFNLAQDVDRHIAWLHEQLKITPAEEPAWNQFAQVMRDNAAAMSQAAEARAQKISAMSAADSMTSYAQLAEQHAQDMARLAASFQTLYGSFSDEQKQTADTLFRHSPGAPPHHHAG